MLRRHAQLRTALLVAADLLTTAASLVGAYALRFGSGLFEVTRPWVPERYLMALPPALLLCLATYAAAGSYRPPRRSSFRGAELRRAVAAGACASLLLAAGTLFYRDRYEFSRGLILIFAVLSVPLLFLGRSAAYGVLTWLHRRGVGVSRAVVAGLGPSADALVRTLAAHPWLGVEVVARVTRAEAAPGAVRDSGAEQVFLAFPAKEHRELQKALSLLEDEMVNVRAVPDFGPATTLNPEVFLLDALPLVTLRQTPFYGMNRFAKRGLDLLLGGIALLALLPFLGLVAVVQLVLNGRPIFYSQERTGLDGRRFRMLKFRTMRVGAEAATGAVWARRGDPRCTALGRLLRRFSLDELPQLLNVLRGEMSLVGPRPERPVLIERFREALPDYMLRHRIPAGLTGWAQVNGLRGDTDLGERLRYDLAYLEGWSLLFDVEILLRTLWQVVRGTNAV